jgi:hypothetical protein
VRQKAQSSVFSTRPYLRAQNRGAQAAAVDELRAKILACRKTLAGMERLLKEYERGLRGIERAQAA